MEVRATCRWVADHASHVTINSKGIEKVADAVDGVLPEVKWDFEGIHFFDNGPLTVQYLLVLDALNFCFWPDEELHYEHLARGLKLALEADNTAFDAVHLQSYTGMEVINPPRAANSNIQLTELFLHYLLVCELSRPNVAQASSVASKLPLEEERVRLLCEVGLALEKNFGGHASNLVAAAKGSAVALVELVASHFPVPAVLRHWGILEYSTSLAATVDGQKELSPGSEEEVEIRACTITAVERLRETLSRRTQKEVMSVQVDWWLWSSGIESLKAPYFHHTLTVYY